MNVGEKKYHGYNKIDDGRLLFTADYTDMENLITWILTFGDKAEVLEPEIRQRYSNLKRQEKKLRVWCRK